MVTRRSPGTANATLRLNHVLAATVAVLWLVTTGYGQDKVSPCSKNNAGCQHKCRVVNGTDGVLAYKCVCNTGYQLAEDKHNCVLVNEFLLYMQNSAIRGKVLNNNVTKRTEFIINKYIAAILPVSITTGILFSIDFDAHDNYIYYSYYYSWVDTNNNFKNKFIISRINTNGTGSEIVLSPTNECIYDLGVDWVGKNIYYSECENETLNVVSIRNMTNKRVLLKNVLIPMLVVHPNKGYIFFIEEQHIYSVVYRACMDGSNLISYNTKIVTIGGFAVDFVKDRLYWTNTRNDTVYHSNLDLTDVNSITSYSIKSPQSLVIYKDWMYINVEPTTLKKLHKITGELVDVEVKNFGSSSGYISDLMFFSKHGQFINNTHPCSITANYGGCQKLCFAVPSNNSGTLSLQALCGCSDGEKVDSNGKSCVVISVSTGVINHIPYHYVTTVSLILLHVFSNYS